MPCNPSTWARVCIYDCVCIKGHHGVLTGRRFQGGKVIKIEKSDGRIGSSHGIWCRHAELKKKKTTYTIAPGIMLTIQMLYCSDTN